MISEILDLPCDPETKEPLKEDVRKRNLIANTLNKPCQFYRSLFLIGNKNNIV